MLLIFENTIWTYICVILLHLTSLAYFIICRECYLVSSDKKIKGFVLLEYKVIDCSGKNCDLKLYNESYQLWYGVWSKTYKDVIRLDEMSSDQFLVNDKAGVILWKQKPVALFLLSQFNPNALVNHKRSYILNYPKSIFQDSQN